MDSCPVSDDIQADQDQHRDETDPTSAFIREISQEPTDGPNVPDESACDVPMGMDPAVTWMSEEVMSALPSSNNATISNSAAANFPNEESTMKDANMEDVLNSPSFMPDPFFEGEPARPQEWLPKETPPIMAPKDTGAKEVDNNTNALENLISMNAGPIHNNDVAVTSNAISEENQYSGEQDNVGIESECPTTVVSQDLEAISAKIEPCGIASKLPITVQSWLNNVTCTGSESHCFVKDLSGSYPEYLNDGKMTDVKIAILKRCGASNDDLKVLESETICPNHIDALSCNFPVQTICQICQVPVNRTEGKVVTAYLQDILIDYIPGAIFGQLLCSECSNKVQSISSKRLQGSERAFGRRLVSFGIISGETFDKVNLTKQSENVNDVKKEALVWTSISATNPSELSKSIVPPLRYLSRGFQNLRCLSSPKGLTLREMVELRLTIKSISMHNMNYQNEICNKWKQIGVSRSLTEFFKVADAAINFTELAKEEILQASDKNEEEKRSCLQKLNFFYNLKYSQLNMMPDGKDLGTSVPYVNDNGEMTFLCLASSSGANEVSVCDLNPETFSYSNLEMSEKGELSISQHVSKVAPLRFVASGIFGKSLNIPKMWKYLTIQSSLDISSTLKGQMDEANNIVRTLIFRGVLLPTTYAAFQSKCRALTHLLEDFIRECHSSYQEERKRAQQKLRQILNVRFYDCDPWYKRSKYKKGIWVFKDEEGSTFMCSQCPYTQCDGTCAVPSKSIAVLASRKRDIPSRNSSAMGTNSEEQDDSSVGVESLFLPECQIDEDSNGYNEHNNTIDSPCDDASFYFTSSQNSDITFDFLFADFNAAYDYLVCQSDPTFWTVTEGKHEMIMERGPHSVHVNIRRNEQRGRTVCKIGGSGIEYFIEEILPSLVKMTSCRYLDLDAKPANGSVNEPDDDDDSNFHHDPLPEEPEMVFVEEMSSSSVASPMESAITTTPSHKTNGNTASESKKARNFQCWGCKQKFKYENAYIKHETSCKRAGLPQDVRSFPCLKNGRKPCPGCGRVFAGKNISYLKHVRSCSKIKRDGFLCKTCPAKFSTAKTLGLHAGMCAKYRKRKRVIVPQLTKRLKIQSVVSLNNKKGSQVNKTNNARGRNPVPKAKPKAKTTFRQTIEYHKVICQLGSYKCPLCGIRFRMNQPYGKHLKNQECVRRKGKKAPDKSTFNLLYITIHPGVAGDDSVIGFNRVPSLRMLCRGVQSKKSLIKPSKLPALTIKEGLEVYYSLKRSNKTLDREERWRYLTDRHIFPNFGSSSAFMTSATTVLKTVNFFEEKVKIAKTGRNAVLMKKWNDKLNVFLSMPYHDNFNTAQVGKFRAFEYPSEDCIQVLCLNCYDLNCSGCIKTKVAVKVSSAPKSEMSGQPEIPPGLPIQPNIVKMTKIVNRTQQNNGNQLQRTYFEATNVWKSKAELRDECERVGSLMGYKRSATLTEAIKYSQGQLTPKTKMVHFCPHCSDTFRTASDLQKHQVNCVNNTTSTSKDCSVLDDGVQQNTPQSNNDTPDDDNTGQGDAVVEDSSETPEQQESLFSMVEDVPVTDIPEPMNTGTIDMPWIPDQDVGGDECILPD